MRWDANAAVMSRSKATTLRRQRSFANCYDTAVTSTSPFPVLNNTHHSHEAFDASRDLEKRLQATIRGEVRFDAASRALYAVDASNYRQVPIGLVIPRDADDVQAAI